MWTFHLQLLLYELSYFFCSSAPNYILICFNIDCGHVDWHWLFSNSISLHYINICCILSKFSFPFWKNVWKRSVYLFRNLEVIIGLNTHLHSIILRWSYSADFFRFFDPLLYSTQVQKRCEFEPAINVLLQALELQGKSARDFWWKSKNWISRLSHLN